MSTPLFTNSDRPRAKREADHLAAQLCAALKNPPRSQLARRQVAEDIELVAGGQRLGFSTCHVGPRAIEVISKTPLTPGARVRARRSHGEAGWSDALVSQCDEALGGWRIEVVFGVPGGSC